MGEDGDGGFGIVQGIMGAIERDPEPIAEIAETMGEGAFGIEGPGHPQRADDRIDIEGDPMASGGLLQESGVEGGVVGHRDDVAQALADGAEGPAHRGCAEQVAPSQAVDVGGADPPQRPVETDERAPPVDDRRRPDRWRPVPIRRRSTYEVDITGDDGDLEDAIVFDVETGRLDVEDGEAGRGRGVDEPTVGRGCDAIRCVVRVGQRAMRARMPIGAATVKPAR